MENYKPKKILNHTIHISYYLQIKLLDTSYSKDPNMWLCLIINSHAFMSF